MRRTETRLERQGETAIRRFMYRDLLDLRSHQDLFPLLGHTRNNCDGIRLPFVTSDHILPPLTHRHDYGILLRSASNIHNNNDLICNYVLFARQT